MKWVFDLWIMNKNSHPIPLSEVDMRILQMTSGVPKSKSMTALAVRR